MKAKLKFGTSIISSVRMFLVLVLALVSCTKFGKNIYVDGRVYNPVTGEGIAGVDVKLYRNKLDSSDPLGSDSKRLKVVTTDENGYYRVEYLASPFFRAFVQVNDAGYYPIGWVGNGSTGSAGIKKGKKNHMDFEAVPYGEIKISIHNINCQSSDDTLIYKRNYVSLSGVSVFQPFTLTGCYSNEGSFAKVPSGNYSIEWTVIRSGISNSYSHILTVPENGQVSYNIDY